MLAQSRRNDLSERQPEEQAAKTRLKSCAYRLESLDGPEERFGHHE